MKKTWLLLVILSLSMAPALGLAGAPPGLSPASCDLGDKLDDQQLAQSRGQGWERVPVATDQGGRIVIWDEWGQSSAMGKGGEGASPGLGSINYGQRQATFTATR
jgi:hypothetical protein